MTPRRLRCARCERPQSTCLCAWVAPTPNQAQVLILQHPLEAQQAKGSARLLHLSLQHSQLLTGETFDPDSLAAHLAEAPRCHVLLYPLDAGQAASSPLPTDPGLIRLVVLDGTWRKSRKMLHLNPALQALPRLALKEPPASAYRIRKAHKPDQLSTLEATCLALAQLESAPERYTPLLSAFDTFVASQLR